MSTAPPARTGTAATDRFPALDAMRGLGALAVVLTHTGFETGRAVDEGPFAPVLARLDLGVTLFFLLSGFLLYRPFLAAAVAGRPLPGSRTFLVRRFWRIAPAYWVVLAATAVVLPQADVDGRDWLRYATLTHTYAGANEHTALTQMWSLVVEVSFYLLLPVLVRLTVRPGPRRRLLRTQAVVVAALLVAGPAYGAAVKAVPALENRLALLWLPAYLDWFALGMGLALVHTALGVGAWPRVRRVVDQLAAAPGTCWAVALPLFGLATTRLGGPLLLDRPTTWEWLAKHVLYGVTSLFVLFPAVFGGTADDLPRRILRSRPARWLGEISYGVYLWHLLVLFTLVDLLGYRLFQGGFAVLLPLTAAISVILAGLSHVLLERPIQRRVRRGRQRPGDSSGFGSASPPAEEAATAAAASATTQSV